MRARALLLFLLVTTSAAAEADRLRTHVVYDGQRLGTIARRYNVSVDALCTANRIRTTDPIRPGQRLVIPAPGDRDGERARAEATRSASMRTVSPDSIPEERTPVHRVESGQRLETIARRYRVSVDALCTANGIGKKSLLRVGQELKIPHGRSTADTKRAGPRPTGYRAYFRAPRRKGYIELVGHTQRFRGHVFDKKGNLLPAARAGIARVLAATGSRPQPDRRLVRLLVELSDKFGGRPLRVVSGYRSASFFEDSRHKSSRAVDLSIPGVPNEALRDYLRTLSQVGVGFYPNSSFIHLDVRDYAAYWVDYAGPGEAPRRNAIARRPREDVHDNEPADVPASTDARPGAIPAAPFTARQTGAQSAPVRGPDVLAQPATGDVPNTVQATSEPY